MPADFFIDTHLRMVFSKAVGLLSSIDAIDHMDRLQKHPDFRPEFNQLFDFRQARGTNLSNDELRRLANRSIFSDNSRRAFVVGSDADFGIGRIFSTYRDIRGEKGIRIFREMEKALAWLSLSAEPDPGLFKNLGPAGNAT